LEWEDEQLGAYLETRDADPAAAAEVGATPTTNGAKCV
jgi:hypothetical protein